MILWERGARCDVRTAWLYCVESSLHRLTVCDAVRPPSLCCVSQRSGTHISLGKSGLFCANESLLRVLRAVLCAVLRVLQAWELQVQQTQKAWKRTRKLLCAVTVSSNCNLCAVQAWEQ